MVTAPSCVISSSREQVPVSILVANVTRMSLTCYKEFGRVYEDATRKLLPWNLGLHNQGSGRAAAYTDCAGHVVVVGGFKRTPSLRPYSTTPTPTPTRPTRLHPYVRHARFPREDVGVMECGFHYTRRRRLLAIYRRTLHPAAWTAD